MSEEVIPFKVGQFVRLWVQWEQGDAVDVTGYVSACDASLVTLDGGVTYNMRSRNWVAGEVLNPQTHASAPEPR